MTRCATLMPSPMMFIWPFKSLTRRTGPRLTPMRTPTEAAMSRIAIEANRASSGSPMKVTAAPSPVSRMMRSREATCSSAWESAWLKACLSCSCSETGFLEYSAMSRNSTLQTNVRPEPSIRCPRPCGKHAPRRELFYAHAGLRPRVGANEENPRPVARRGEHHSLRNAEFHLARREIRDDHGQAALELLGAVGGLDAREHRACGAAQIQGELEQLVGALDVLGMDDSRHAQIQLVEVVDGDGLGHGLLLGGMRLPGMALRRPGRCRQRRGVEEAVELLLLDPVQQMAIFVDPVPARERPAGIRPLQTGDIEETLRLGGK